VGNPEELSVRDVARKVMACFGREIDIEAGELTAGSTQRRCPDISKIGALGFVPAIGFDQGLPAMVDWYVANAHLKP
jgi:nucleoside-diphosphate-sugar epimerase